MIGVSRLTFLHRRAFCSLLKMDTVADVDIESTGVFKYILIRLQSGDAEKFVVRGYSDCPYHADILDRFEAPRGVSADCVGGGRIRHNSSAKTIFVYGYSMGFGRADHTVTVAKLKAAYPNYADISWSNEGY